jgi:hypothetical protein
MGHLKGYFEGAKTFLTPKIVPSAARDILGVKKDVLKMRQEYQQKSAKI